MTQEPFGDIPLFREIQRLLASSSGPVNYESARQVAVAAATEGRAEAPPDPAARRALLDAVRSSELVVGGFTRLPVEEPIQAEVVGRSRWVAATLEGWKWLFAHLATRFSGEVATFREQETSEGDPMHAALSQVGPLLIGMQVGTLVGQLGKQALARYDHPIPRDDDGRLLFVASNIGSACDDYDFAPDHFYAWLALHEVARHIVLVAIPWTHRYFKSLLLEVVDAIEIDLSELERRIVDLQAQGLGALQGGDAGIVPVVPTERHRRALERLRSFLALFEGYANHAAGSVASEIVGDTSRIDEGMARRRASTGEGEALLANILGISVDRALETSGATFCAAVSKLKGPGALNRVWAAPDNLPSAEELRDPFAWMERQGL
jgi:putative hydrolase